jgi:SAM-dependent methyltransferase
MPAPMDFPRYLRAKQTVDDRSLNRWVYGQLQAALAAWPAFEPLSLVEIGCGLGTMVARLWDWHLAPRVRYLALDQDPALIAAARPWLQEFAAQRGLACQAVGEELWLQEAGREWQVRFLVQDFLTAAPELLPAGTASLVLAHAVLDLLNLQDSLPRLRRLLRPGGLGYLTLNYDGLTILAPPLDPELEAAILTLYHRSMDCRQQGQGGHSQTGRRLLAALLRDGAQILAAGSSDWLVWPDAQGRYPAEEAYFLECLLNFIEAAVKGRPELDQDRLAAWLAGRRAQIAGGELVFLAHQLDVLYRI